MESAKRIASFGTPKIKCQIKYAKKLYQSEFHRAGRKILLHHQSNFEYDCVVELTEIETGELLDFLKAINQRITVNK